MKDKLRTATVDI